MPDVTRPQIDSALEIAARIARADAAQLPQLDEWARGQLAPSWDAGPQWQEWGPLVRVHPELRLALACAPSGHVREQACGLLAAHPSAPGLGLLLLRSNDWVYFVRAEARAALAVYEHPALAAWWIEYLPLVLRFGQDVRAPFPSLFGRVQALLASPEAAEALRAGWRSPDVTVRRGLLQMFGSLGIDAEILSLLTGDPDVRIRRTLVPLSSPDTLQTLMRDPDVRVRALALTRLLPTLAAEPETPEIQHALLDTHSSVRWQVQYALRQAGHDVRQLYLAAADLSLAPREQLGFLGGLNLASVSPAARSGPSPQPQRHRWFSPTLALASSPLPQHRVTSGTLHPPAQGPDGKTDKHPAALARGCAQCKLRPPIRPVPPSASPPLDFCPPTPNSKADA